MPMTFGDLPVELLPLILQPLAGRRSDLRNATLVCRQWRAPAEALQYSWIRLWGRDLAIAPLVFQTLADNPHLCRLIHKLEVRVFALSLILRERLEMERVAVQVLRQSVNLRELLWTRKGALTDRVFEAITSLPHLDSFEFNAHTNLSPGSWDVEHLLQLPQLKRISLVLPDRKIANILPSFLDKQRQLARSHPGASHDTPLRLEELTILCRESPIISDRVIALCFDALSGSSLRSLALAGCSKLIGSTLLPLLSSLHHLEHLALEATSIPPSFYLSAAPFLKRLKSLKLTHPGPRHPLLAEFWPALSDLVRDLDELEAFTLYHSGASNTAQREWPAVDAAFIREIAGNDRRLKKFECSGVLMNEIDVEHLCLVSALRDLVVHLGWGIDLPRLTQCISHLPNLKTLHILAQKADVGLEPIESIASLSPSLRQIGFRNRVWHVRRRIVATREGEETYKVSLREGTEAFGAFRRGRYGAEDDTGGDTSGSSEDEN